MVTRCLNQIDGHSTEVLGLLKITSITDSPDIYFLSFAKNETSVCFSVVDESEMKRLNNEETAVGLSYSRSGSQVVQIITGKPYDGFTFALLEKQRSTGAFFLSVWSFK